MNLYLIRNKPALLLLVFISFLTSYAQSQRVFSSIGVATSSIHYNFKNIKYEKPIMRSSLSLGYESKIWHRLSYSTVFSNFTSGGKKKNNLLYHEFENYDRVYIDNYSFGVIGNFYPLNRKTQIYLGFGPRLDYVRSDNSIIYEWIDDLYDPLYLNELVWGITGNIGVNFQIDNFNFGFKSNYYYRPYIYRKVEKHTLTDYTTEKIVKDKVFDLQLVLGYTFNKNKTKK